MNREKEFFECDCYGKDHLIRAEYDENEYQYGNDSKITFRELSIMFTTRAADYDVTSLRGFFGWLKRMKWRIKTAFKLLIIGEIETEGCFTPCRTFTKVKENPVESEFGYETTKNLAKWLDTYADKIKELYEKDIEEYKKTQKNSTI